MPWWSISKIPNECLTKFAFKFIIQCPSSIRKKEKIGINYKGKPDYKSIHEPVSNRKCSFKERIITGDLLITILTQIRKSINKEGIFAAIDIKDNVENKIQDLMKNEDFNDKNFDIVVFNKRDDMPETEAFYYCIRNSFAHGSFEVKRHKGGNIYLLECRKNGQIKAQMRIKENKLKQFIELLEMTPAQIREMRVK